MPDFQKMESITLANQEWLVLNLNVDTFRNGDPILHAQTDEEWENAGDDGIPAWCYYNNNPCNARYGRLYNFHAVEDIRGLAPEGWHIPSDEEWNRLQKFIKANPGDKLKSESGWFNDGNGSNESGFSAKPGGIRYYDGAFLYYGTYAFFWTSSSVIIQHGWLRYMRDDYGEKIFRTKGGKAAGLSVRCIKDYDNTDAMPYE